MVRRFLPQQSENDYVFATSTAGKLTGTVVLTKTNTGTLSIVTDNNNAGANIINQGRLQIGTNGTSGTLSGSVTINTNGVLAHNNPNTRVLSDGHGVDHIEDSPISSAVDAAAASCGFSANG